MENSVRKRAHELLDHIIDSYDDVESGNRECQFDRIGEAERCTRIFWQIYHLVLGWAENIHIGVFLVENSKTYSQIAEKMRADRGDDPDWVFEEIGGWQSGTYTGELFVKYFSGPSDEEFFSYPEDYDESALDRYVAYYMTQCVDTRSNTIEALNYALYCVQHGDAHSMFEVANSRHGSGITLLRTRLRCVCRVLFICGQGSSKRQAREVVGEGLGVSPFTLKNWEMEFQKDREHARELILAHLAGQYHQEVREWNEACWNEAYSRIQSKYWHGYRDALAALPDESDLHESWSGRPKLWWIWQFCAQFEELGIDRLRQELRDARNRDGP